MTAFSDTATAQDLFFGGPGQPVETLTQLLREHDTNVGPFPPSLMDSARHELAAATAELTSVNLADVMAAGWKKYDALIKAARSTRDDRNATELVSLATHKITSDHHPSIDLCLDSKRLAAVQIGIDITLTIAGAIAVVKQGRLMEIRAGSCTASGSLAIRGVELMKKQTKFDLRGAFRLGKGVSLLQPTPSDDTPESVATRRVAEPTASGAWRPDPTGRYESRWWDGSRWTEHVATNGHRMRDPDTRGV